jgi:rubrerythrin
MYPQFITNAAAAKSQLAQISLNYAYKTEQKHKPLYEKALAALDANTVKALPQVYYICPTCGNTYDAAPPKRCGISMTNSEKFIRVTTITS